MPRFPVVVLAGAIATVRNDQHSKMTTPGPDGLALQDQLPMHAKMMAGGTCMMIGSHS